MNKLLHYLLISMALSLYGCGGGSGDSESGGTQGNGSPEQTEPPSKAFTATLYDQDTGQPIEGAFYFIHTRVFEDGRHHMADDVRYGGKDSEYYRQTIGTTDINGSINTDDIIRGDYSFKLSAEGYLPIYWRSKDNYFDDSWSVWLTPALTDVSADNAYYDFYNYLEDNPVGYGYATARLDGFLIYETLTENEGMITPSEDIRNFIKVRYDKLIQELQQDVTELTIWHVANMGVIIKEGDTVIGIDLDMRYFSVLDHKLFNEIDYFFATHEHNDHFNTDVAIIAQEFGKPYHLPAAMKDGFDEAEWDNHNSLMIQDAVGVNSGDVLDLGGGWQVKVKEASHTSDVTNLTYFITSPSGVTILHTGDGMVSRAVGSDNDWFPAEYKNLDFVFTAIWQPELEKVYSDSTPRAFIPLHIMELGHDSYDRYKFSSLSSFSHPERIMLLYYGDKITASDLNPL
ncbi:MBL fold metallo-hydrolase [Vibrio alfacsensis]|uniref:MBL fold metallo-hydrolase n=1 Tax=Vibrio alfacsensis TaxID=1074311 RepID=UPI0040691A50